MLAVTNDQIWQPIIFQNRRNKQTYDTYAFTFDLVPLVLEKTCFVGHIFEYKWKINKTKAQIEGVKQKCAKEIRREAHLHNLPGQNTTVDGVQAHSGTDLAKAVARQAHQGAGAPWVRPHPHRLFSAPHFYSGCMPPCIGGSWVFPNLSVLNHPHSTI